MSQPIRQWKISLSDLAYGKEEEDAVLEVMRSRWLTMGPKTEEFEKAIATMIGVEHAVMVSSCTAGLHLLLATLGIGPGDEVIVPALTFVATASSVLNCGATPVFADIISPELPLMDPQDVKRNMNASTRAVLTVDYAGYPCDYDAMQVVIADFEASRPARRSQAQRQPIHLIEDAAHGIGGALDEQRSLGNCCDAGVFSFFSNKNLATGEGGMIVTNRADIADKSRMLRRHGMTLSTWERHLTGPMEYDVAMPGWNFRPTELQSAIGIAQLKKLEMNTWRRHALVQRYQARLAEVKEIVVPFAHVKTWYFPACHIFPILAPDGPTRVRIRETLQAKGIQTSHHYRPVHQFEYYHLNVPTAQVHLPNTENFAEREITLPLHPGMTAEDVDLVVEGVREGLGH